jgi:hypothetical protein
MPRRISEEQQQETDCWSATRFKITEWSMGKQTHARRSSSMPVSALATADGKQENVLPELSPAEKDENKEIIWPALSNSEMCKMPERVAKRARHDTGGSSGEVCNEASLDLVVDSVNFFEAGTNCKSANQQDSPDLLSWTLQKSNHLCNPFFLGDRGSELWRDFL